MRPKLITSVRKNCRNFSGAATAHNTLVKTLFLSDTGTKTFSNIVLSADSHDRLLALHRKLSSLIFLGFDLFGEKNTFSGEKKETFSNIFYPLIYTTIC